MLKLIRDAIIGLLTIALVVPVISRGIPETKAMNASAAAAVAETTEETQTTESTEATEATEPTEVVETTEATEPTVVEEPATYFDAEITYTSEYFSSGTIMNHLLFTPSTANDGEKKPLIVWLHGSGELSTHENTFRDSGLLKVMSEWQSEGFDAYILCPHLAGAWNTRVWNAEKTKNNLENLLVMFIEEYNIDTDNIVVIGHSLGGQGALYMAHELDEYFSKCVVLSGYSSGIDNSEITIPTIGFVGTRACGEDKNSINYMENYFVPVFGEENYFSLDTSHGGVPKSAMTIDNNENGRSDLVEWMLGELEVFTN